MLQANLLNLSIGHALHRLSCERTASGRFFVYFLCQPFSIDPPCTSTLPSSSSHPKLPCGKPACKSLYGLVWSRSWPSWLLTSTGEGRWRHHFWDSLLSESSHILVFVFLNIVSSLKWHRKWVCLTTYPPAKIGLKFLKTHFLASKS